MGSIWNQVRAIAALNHRNLVRLLGFCLHVEITSGKQEQILVYEFVGNGDLERHIKARDCKLRMELLCSIFQFQRWQSSLASVVQSFSVCV